MARDGFQPCAVDAGDIAVPSTHHWEKRLVLASLLVHILDVGFDLIVVFLFLSNSEWGFFLCSVGVILWAWLVAGLYISFGGGAAGDIDTSSSGSIGRIPHLVVTMSQLQIFTEAHRCIFHCGDTDYFHTLRLMEAVLESAPSALIQLYALLTWCDSPGGATTLLRLSVFASITSVGCALALWEQKVQFRASAAYVVSVGLLRVLEISSRALTLAVFAASIESPFGLLWALAGDYVVMVLLIIRHKSVQLTYGLFVALPLVLVSLEPLVWRREDHAVPKDAYYLVRVVELVAIWYVIWQADAAVDGISDVAQPGTCDISITKTLAILCTVGLYALLPFVWRFARRHELSRDAADWAEDGAEEGLQGENYEGDENSDSEGSDGGNYAGGGQIGDHDDMPGE